MSIDLLQEKIRKLKNPTMVDLNLSISQLPPHIVEESGNPAAAYGRWCREILTELKGYVPAVRVSFSAFALLGAEGMNELSATLKKGASLRYYVLLDAPEIYSVSTAQSVAEVLFGSESQYPCDGLLISGYLGSDMIKPFLPYCKNDKKDVFVVARTANRSAPELQDLLCGSRLVHSVVADQVSRYTEGIIGKSGYSRLAILAAANAAESLRSLRAKYPTIFLLIDGFGYPNSNAKNCAYAFDKFGHGAVVCSGTAITCAWKQTESDGQDYLQHIQTAAENLKKKLARHVTVL